MSSLQMFDNVFEAVHMLDPGNPMYECRDGNSMLQQCHQFKTIRMEDGTCCNLLPSLNLYRGENKRYRHCRPTLYRYPLSQQHIWQIKECDFELFLLSSKDIQQAIHDGHRVNLVAIAQHYGFPTAMLDVTCDIVVAAYFATHRYDPHTDEMMSVDYGIGRIRQTVAIGDKVVVFGDQLFRRPGRQGGYGYTLLPNEDFSDMSSCVEFKQSAKVNKIFEGMLNGTGIFFPQEQLTVVAELIKNAAAVTLEGIKRYAARSGISSKRLMNLVKKNGIAVVEAQLCHPDILWEPWNSFRVQQKSDEVRPCFFICAK